MDLELGLWVIRVQALKSGDPCAVAILLGGGRGRRGGSGEPLGTCLADKEEVAHVPPLCFQISSPGVSVGIQARAEARIIVSRDDLYLFQS